MQTMQSPTPNSIDHNTKPAKEEEKFKKIQNMFLFLN